LYEQTADDGWLVVLEGGWWKFIQTPTSMDTNKNFSGALDFFPLSTPLFSNIIEWRTLDIDIFEEGDQN
jgi:hypothetical protein